MKAHSILSALLLGLHLAPAFGQGASLYFPRLVSTNGAGGNQFRRQYRSTWARLIQKIYEADPLACPKCHGRLAIVSFLEHPAVVKKILVHLGLWELPERSPPVASPGPDVIYDPDFFRALSD